MESTITPNFTTEDMTLVTVLKTKGIEPTALQRAEGGGCQWVFSMNGTIERTLDEYNADECWVEPREFTRKLGQVRKNMYRFLDVPPRPVR